MALYQLLLVAVVATAASAACTGNKAGLHCGTFFAGTNANLPTTAERTGGYDLESQYNP